MQHGINVNGSKLLIHRHLPFVPCWDIGRTAWGGHRRITGADEQRDFRTQAPCVGSGLDFVSEFKRCFLKY